MINYKEETTVTYFQKTISKTFPENQSFLAKY